MSDIILSHVGLVAFLVDIVVTGALLATLWKRYQKSKMFVVLILFAYYVVDFIAIFIELPFFLANFDDWAAFYLDPNNLSLQFFALLGMVSAGMFLLFIDYFEEDRISVSHASVLAGFLAAYVMVTAFKSIAIQSAVDFIIARNVNFFELLPAFFLTYVVIVTMRALFRIKRESHDAAQQKQVMLMQVAIVFYYVITVFFIVSAKRMFFLSPDWKVFLIHVAPRMSVIIGDVILLMVYARSRLAFLQFQRMEKLLVIADSGLPLFSHDFVKTTKTSNGKAMLLSGGLTAVTSLLSEAVGAAGIRMIQFQDKQIMISHHDLFAVFLIVDRPSTFLWNAIQHFGNAFNREYSLNDQSLATVDTKTFATAGKLVKTSFGL